MQYRKQASSLAVILLLCFSLASSGQQPIRSTPNQSVSTHEAAVRALVEQFLATYAKKDLESLMRLFSTKSPDLPARKESLQKVFADNDHIEIVSLSIIKLNVNGDQANARVLLEMNGLDTKTGKP